VPNKGELEAETLINTATAFSSFLKLPAAGSRNQSNGNLNDRSVAFLWARAGAKNYKKTQSKDWVFCATFCSSFLLMQKSL
jgi:hypothetical protein